MKSEKKSLSRELIVETALQLIDENQGIKGVTLRVIAKELECAHTNLYNYFSSLDEIFWEALGEVLLRMMEYSSRGLKEEGEKEEGLYTLLINTVDFSMEHPGWFRLLWLEEIGGNPSPKVIQILHMPVERISMELMKITNNQLTSEKSDSILAICHSYLHGELCKWINNRNFTNETEETKTRILFNLRHLYKLFLQESKI